MSTKINDGGPAFPVELEMAVKDDDNSLSRFRGMTLRDYFAAKTMQAEISRNGLEGSSVEFTAVMAYEQADAMIAERNK